DEGLRRQWSDPPIDPKRPQSRQESHHRTRVTSALSQRTAMTEESAMKRGELLKPILRWTLAGAITLAPVATRARAAEVLWPSFHWGEPNNAPVMLELKKRFEQDYPGNTVNNVVVPPAAFFDKQFADVASGNPPDVVTLYDPDARAYIEADLLEPLDSYYAAAGIRVDNLVPTIELARKGGKIYAVPFQINARALFYNEKLLKEAGLERPRNFPEFQGAIRKLRK